VPIDYVPGSEALISKTEPLTLYGAFIQSVRERLAQSPGLREANRWLVEWSSREAARLEQSGAEQWQSANEFRRQLAALETVARE
jgi:hypothetical protein